MRYFLICDESDTYTGLRMAGITGIITQDPTEVKQKVEEVVANSDIAILIITEKLADMYRQRIDDLRLNASRPLVVEIPGRGGSIRPQGRITGYIKDAIGIKLK